MRRTDRFAMILMILSVLYGLSATPALAGCPGGVCVVGDTGNATTNGANFSVAIVTAAPGDTIILTSGAAYQGNFQFNNKGSSTSPITVQSSNMGGCAPSGTRVNPPVHALAMPRLIGNGYPAIQVNDGAHNLTFQCLEVTNTQTNYSAGLVQVLSRTPSSTRDIVFDRMFVHNPEVTATNLQPQPTEIWAGRGVLLAGSNLTISNSWIGSFAGYFPNTTTLTDSYGVLIGTSNNVIVQNNQIEAFFNNIFIVGGGVDATKTGQMAAPTTSLVTLSNVNGLNIGDLMAVQVPAGTNSCATDFNNPLCWQTVKVTTISGNLVTYTPYGAGGLTTTPVNGGAAQWNGYNTTNVTVNGNTLWKNPWWQGRWAGGAKDYIEIKSCVNCTYTGNTFQGACAASIAFEAAQACSNGGCPWTTIAFNTFQNNLLLGDVSGPFVPLGGAQASGDFRVSSTPGHDIIMSNNLWTNVVKSCGNNASVSGFMQLGGPGQNFTFTHNTVRNVSTLDIVFASATGLANVTVKDNVFNYGPDGFNYNNPGGYTAAWPPAGIVEQKNVVTTNGPLTNNPAQPGEVPNSYRVSSDSAVGYANLANCQSGVYLGCALSTSSQFHNAASDGTDPGVNMISLNAALSGTPGPGPALLPPSNLQVQ